MSPFHNHSSQNSAAQCPLFLQIEVKFSEQWSKLGIFSLAILTHGKNSIKIYKMYFAKQNISCKLMSASFQIFTDSYMNRQTLPEWAYFGLACSSNSLVYVYIVICNWSICMYTLTGACPACTLHSSRIWKPLFLPNDCLLRSDFQILEFKILTKSGTNYEFNPNSILREKYPEWSQ